jgi:hypothetical protein
LALIVVVIKIDSIWTCSIIALHISTLSTAIGTGFCFNSSIILFNKEYQTFHGSLPLEVSHVIDLSEWV